MSSRDDTIQDHPILDPREAFLVMSEFLWRYARRAGDDLFTLLGDIGLQADGRPTDPAAWEDWLECVRHIKAGLAPDTGGARD
jgi:hypothetical protein